MVCRIDATISIRWTNKAPPVTPAPETSAAAAKAPVPSLLVPLVPPVNLETPEPSVTLKSPDSSAPIAVATQTTENTSIQPIPTGPLNLTAKHPLWHQDNLFSDTDSSMVNRSEINRLLEFLDRDIEAQSKEVKPVRLTIKKKKRQVHRTKAASRGEVASASTTATDESQPPPIAERDIQGFQFFQPLRNRNL